VSTECAPLDLSLRLYAALSELEPYPLYFPGASRVAALSALPLAITFPRLWRSVGAVLVPSYQVQGLRRVRRHTPTEKSSVS
jgi:hypothetical protein